jgi:uncharacterized protein with FMN-binding domain
LLSFRGSAAPIGGTLTLAGSGAAATDELPSAGVPGSAGAIRTAEPSLPTAAADPTADAAHPVTSQSATITGQPVSFRWGTVQVAVTMDGSDILAIDALELPDGDRHSRQISQYVEPILREEAIANDTSEVSVVSGATYTSRAYAASLQSALDQVEA